MVSSSYPRFWMLCLCCSMQEPAELSSGSLLKALGSLAPGAESLFAGKQFYLEACLLIVPYLNVRVYDLGGEARLGARWVCKVDILVFTCGRARHMSRVSQHSRGCCHALCHAAWRHHHPAPLLGTSSAIIRIIIFCRKYGGISLPKLIFINCAKVVQMSTNRVQSFHSYQQWTSEVNIVGFLANICPKNWIENIWIRRKRGRRWC